MLLIPPATGPQSLLPIPSPAPGGTATLLADGQVLVTFYGQTRILMRMSADGMLPGALGLEGLATREALVEDGPEAIDVHLRAEVLPLGVDLLRRRAHETGAPGA